MGKLEAIWTKRAHRGPMDGRLTVRAVPGKGLAGSADNSRSRQITLIEQEVWNLLMQKLSASVSPSGRRANLMVSGISLADSRGRFLLVGSVLLQIGGETKPCERMDEVVKGLRHLMYDNWAGGAFAQVISGGDISIGDPVEWTDDGTSVQLRHRA
jgi:MOSC domain-containing protein YiiM